MRRAFAIALDAFYRFLEDDGWAIASYIALSTLMALFPFLILVTALAAFLGSENLADEVANLLLDTWPKEVAGPIAGEVHRVLTITRGDVLTASAVFSVYFSSSGVESLRSGLNRAYDVKETRNWLWLRLESIAYVLVGALALLALAFLVVLAPLMFATALKYAPWLAPLEATFTFVRFAVATSLITVALFVVHKWLPASERDRDRHRGDARSVARRRHSVRPLPRGIRLDLRHLLCGPRLGDDRAGFPLSDGVDLHVWG
jgi:membrane protein